MRYIEYSVYHNIVFIVKHNKAIEIYFEVYN